MSNVRNSAVCESGEHPAIYRRLALGGSSEMRYYHPVVFAHFSNKLGDAHESSLEHSKSIVRIISTPDVADGVDERPASGNARGGGGGN